MTTPTNTHNNIIVGNLKKYRPNDNMTAKANITIINGCNLITFLSAAEATIGCVNTAIILTNAKVVPIKEFDTPRSNRYTDAYPIRAL